MSLSDGELVALELISERYRKDVVNLLAEVRELRHELAEFTQLRKLVGEKIFDGDHLNAQSFMRLWANYLEVKTDRENLTDNNAALRAQLDEAVKVLKHIKNCYTDDPSYYAETQVERLLARLLPTGEK